jgi:hypothetical protein
LFSGCTGSRRCPGEKWEELRLKGKLETTWKKSFIYHPKEFDLHSLGLEGDRIFLTLSCY